MPREISFEPFQEGINYHSHVLIGHQEDVLAAVQGEKLSLPFETSLAASLVRNVRVSDSSGGGVANFLGVKGSATQEFSTLVALLTPAPKGTSRHNCPTRPETIAALFKRLVSVEPHPLPQHSSSGSQDAKKAKAGVPVVRVTFCAPSALSDLAGTILAVSVAIARACPLYLRKGGVHETEGDMALVVSFLHDGVYVNDPALLSIASHAADGVRNAGKIVDMPANEFTTASFVELSINVAQELKNKGVQVNVIKGEELMKQGFGGIFNVGKASAFPPALVHLSYNPQGAEKTLTWCGKGIIFDTGGMSMKDRLSMVGMKCDMGGAAAILFAFRAAVLLGLKHNLNAILCIAENSVSEKAMRPDDIITLYSGKTVEVNNTDAEGRLVLGDGVAFAARHTAPHLVLDMCTLTGAQGIATGALHAAILCSDEELEHKALHAGRVCGDLTHAVPYSPELFLGEFASKIADMKNSVKNRSNAQVSCAGHFIEAHLPHDYRSTMKWLHVDMAAPVEKEERGTGYGVALLLQLFVLHDAL